MDRSGPKPRRVFESASILVYLAEKFGDFLPTDLDKRTETFNWLFWQMGSAPYLGGGFGHFYAYAPSKMEYPINRFAMETKRQLDVLDRHLADNEYFAGDTYTIARHGGVAVVRRACEGAALRCGGVPGGPRVQARQPVGRTRLPSGRPCSAGGW